MFQICSTDYVRVWRRFVITLVVNNSRIFWYFIFSIYSGILFYTFPFILVAFLILIQKMSNSRKFSLFNSSVSFFTVLFFHAQYSFRFHFLEFFVNIETLNMSWRYFTWISFFTSRHFYTTDFFRNSFPLSSSLLKLTLMLTCNFSFPLQWDAGSPL